MFYQIGYMIYLFYIHPNLSRLYILLIKYLVNHESITCVDI